MILKTMFSSSSLESVANNSLLQESLACADTTCSLLYYVNRYLCVCVPVHWCQCAKTHSAPNAISPPPFLPLSSPLSLCFSYITARRPRPNLHFSSFAPLSVFFIPSSFLPTPLSCFSTSFCSVEGRERGGL